MAFLQVERADQVAEALELRRAGHGLDQIAQRLGVSKRTAGRRVTAAYRAMGYEDADEIRREIADTLDALRRRLARFQDRVLSLDDEVKLAQAIVAVESTRALLLGANTPSRMVVEHELARLTRQERDLAATLQELERRVAAWYAD